MLLPLPKASVVETQSAAAVCLFPPAKRDAGVMLIWTLRALAWQCSGDGVLYWVKNNEGLQLLGVIMFYTFLLFNAKTGTLSASM